MRNQVMGKMHKKISWLGLARAAWLTLAALILLALVSAVPVFLQQQQQICNDPAAQCAQNGLMTAERLRQFEAMGISSLSWAMYALITRLIITAVFSMVALLIFLRKPGEWMPLFVAFNLLTTGANNGVINSLVQANPDWAIPVKCLTGVTWISILLFYTLFPSGQFAPRWMRWVVLVYAGLMQTTLFFPGTRVDIATYLPEFAMIYFPSMFAFMLGSQVYRYRRVSSPTQRQQTRWVVYGIVMKNSLMIAFSIPMIFSPEYRQSTFFFILSGGLANLTMLVLPFSISAAMLHSRLWDIDRLINRTLVYGALTLAIGASYVLLVSAISSLFQVRDDRWISLMVTCLVAVLFQPLRQALQQGVNRLLYGQRDEPDAVLSRLGSRLGSNLLPDSVLPAIVETTAQALKLPYAAILLGSDDRRTLGAEYPTNAGEWTTGTFLGHYPIRYQGELLGELVVVPRTADEPPTEQDQRLLVDVARQAGMAIHAVRLTFDLQHAREQLVLAIEDERRRLRRDLHDGLGPLLANVAMLAETARDVYPHDPARGELLLNKAVEQDQTAIEDIRRLVYNLRPPALDELGLIGALRSQITGYEHTNIQFHFNAPETLPSLPAAVEVAAYRIAQEAVNNVVRHAQAKECFISLVMADRLELSIRDDGDGVSELHRTGIGLFSMRERAVELGGIFRIETLHPGTHIQVQLPIQAGV